MTDELNTAIADFQKKWQALVAKREDKEFFEKLRPTAVAWKTEDLADFDFRFALLRDQADHIHVGWINGRWLATFHLRETTLMEGITIVKLMQRRPGSTDPIGLDHIDFYFKPESADAKAIFSKEPDLEWSEEVNGDHCEWLSIWFENTEAKIRTNTTVDVCIDELRAVSRQVLAD